MNISDGAQAIWIKEILLYETLRKLEYIKIQYMYSDLENSPKKICTLIG